MIAFLITLSYGFNPCRTLTTPVALTKCLESIKKHAFVKSDFPVILTLEDHLTPKLQAKFAEVSALFDQPMNKIHLTQHEHVNIDNILSK